jgi:hypothetical protein
MFTKSELIDLQLFLEDVIKDYGQREKRAIENFKEKEGKVPTWKAMSDIARENRERAEELERRIVEELYES